MFSPLFPRFPACQFLSTPHMVVVVVSFATKLDNVIQVCLKTLSRRLTAFQQRSDGS